MKIGSILENQKIEKRIAITPEIAKKYISLGFDVQLSKDYGTHLGIIDEEYKKLGVNFSSEDNEILNSNIVDVIKTNRGGKTTYHGPGQRVVYFMLNLNNKKKDIRKFITIIEQSLIDFLKNYKINATTFRDRVGIWVTGKDGQTFDKEEKIGAIGLRLHKWITYHGLSFNIKPDMTNYEYINACGLENFKNTSLFELGINLNEECFDNEYSKIFLKNLQQLK